MSVATELAELFGRDLTRLIRQIEAFPDEESLWRTPPGIANSAGNLCLHLEGNLREYVGRQLGKLPYGRDRPQEFAAKGASRTELCQRIAALQTAIPMVIEQLTAEQLELEYPEAVLGTPMPARAFLFHLYGHLNWHLGQIHYLRCLLAGA